MSSVATAPHGEVAMMCTMAVPRGVPVIVLPVAVRPAGKPWMQTVASGVAVMTVVNGRPTVPFNVVDTRVGTGQGWIVMATDAVAPHEAVAVMVAVPLVVGVPEITIPSSVRPAGR